MKPFLPFVLALAGIAGGGPAAQAQAVPNGGFETWQARTGYETPQGWQTSDDLLANGGFPLPLQTVSKSTDHSGGQFSVKLQAKSLLGTALVPGILVLGRITGQNTDVVGGIPYSGRPTQLQLQYKFPGLATDSAYVVVALTRGNLNAPDGQTVGGGSLDFTGGKTTFRAATVPIQYASNLTPDTLRIFFVTGIDVNPPSAGAAFFVDDVALSSAPLAAARAVVPEAVQVYPNPSAGGTFTLSADREPDLLAGALTVVNSRGQVVLTEPAQPAGPTQSRSVQLPGQPAGLYWLRLTTPRGVLTRPLLIP